MKGLTKSQLLEYVNAKRNFCQNEYRKYKDAENDLMAENMWNAHKVLDTVYCCMTDKDYARASYFIWTGKEL